LAVEQKAAFGAASATRFFLRERRFIGALRSGRLAARDKQLKYSLN
jgi:hypothetical protein